MDILKDYVKQNSRTLRFEPGKSISAIFAGVEVVPNKYGEEGDTTLRYSFNVDGAVKWLFSGSIALAEQMSNHKPGETVEICCDIKGGKKKYSLLERQTREDFEGPAAGTGGDSDEEPGPEDVLPFGDEEEVETPEIPATAGGVKRKKRQ